MSDIEEIMNLYGWNAFGYSSAVLAKELLHYGHIKYEASVKVGRNTHIRVFEIYIHGSVRMANGWYQLIKVNNEVVTLEPIPACSDHIEGRFEGAVLCEDRHKRCKRQVALSRCSCPGS